jgi:hypothetical protein
MEQCFHRFSHNATNAGTNPKELPRSCPRLDRILFVDDELSLEPGKAALTKLIHVTAVTNGAKARLSSPPQ